MLPSSVLRLGPERMRLLEGLFDAASGFLSRPTDESHAVVGHGQKDASHLDDHVAAVAGQAPQRAPAHVAADAVEHEVDPPPAGRVRHSIDEVGAPVVDRHVGAEFTAQRRLAFAAPSGQHASAGRGGQLHSGRPDAAGTGMHQDGLACGEPVSGKPLEACAASMRPVVWGNLGKFAY